MDQSDPWTWPATPPTAPPAQPPTGWPEDVGPGPQPEPTLEQRSSRSRLTKTVAVGALGVGLALGGFTVANAASSPTAPPSTPASAGGTKTPGRSNEDPTHETGENAQRAADEKAGKVGGGSGSDENATHEAGESNDRETHEGNAGRGSSATPPTTEATPGL